ncbi:MAG: hypothetical protein NT013_24805, partial [Planctomycetia bacterium]|nr:hypothetical protein [Planctomycetia bacterium]
MRLISWLHSLQSRCVRRLTHSPRCGSLKRRADVVEMSLLSESLEDRTLLVPSVSFEADFSGNEGTSGVNGDLSTAYRTIFFTLSSPATEPVYVYAEAFPGTAIPDQPNSDYFGTQSGVIIPIGATRWGFGFTVAADATPEANEFFYLRITSAYGATIGDGEAIVTLINDDGPMATTISIDDVAQYEGNSGTSTMSFQVTLSNSSTSTVTVGYATTNGSATAGSDYTATSGTLTFNPGVTSQTVNVTVQGDTNDEPNEGFFVNLSGPTNATLADGQGSGLIVNDDLPPPTGVVRLKATQPNAAEQSTAGDGTTSGTQPGEFTISLDFALTYALTVNYLVTGTATSGTDYALNPTASVTIPAGAMSATVIVTPVNDGVDDSGENVILTLDGGSASYAIYAGYESATVTIRDYGILVLRPEDGDNPQDYPTDDECNCECEGSTSESEKSSVDQLSLQHSNRAASPQVSHLFETNVSPNSVPGSTAIPTQQSVHLEISNRVGLVVGSRDFAFDLTDKSVGNNIRMGVETQVANLPSDTYSFNYQLKTLFSDGTTSATQSISIDEGIENHANQLGGSQNVALRADYGFGDGWELAGLKTAREWDVGVPAERQGVAINLGSGETKWFKKGATTGSITSYQNPYGVFGPGLTKDNTTGKFLLTDKFGTKSEFSSSGYITKETDRNGRVTNFSYDAANSNRLVSVIDSYGKGLSLTYNSSTGFVSTMTDSQGRVYSFLFDASTGRLASITAPDPDGVANSGQHPIRTGFGYDASGRVTARTTRKMDGGSNPLQESTQFDYDSRGRLTKETHWDEVVNGQAVVWNFTPIESSANIIDGGVATAATSSNPAPLMAAGDITSVTTSPTGNITKTTVDWANRIIKFQESHDGDFLTSLFQYDVNGLLTHETLPTVMLDGGGTQTLEYAYTYDTNGNLTEAKTLSNGYVSGVGAIQQRTYDSNFGQLQYFIDALGRTQQSDVQWTGAGANGNTSRIYDPVPPGATNGMSWITDMKYTDFVYYPDGTPQAGLIQSITTADPDGSASGTQARSKQEFTYDARGNVLTVTDVLPTGNLTRTFTYDANDHLLAVKNEANTTILDLSNYSPLGLPQTVKQLPGTANERLTTYVYDGLGNIVSVTLPDPDGAGTQYTSPVYQFVYDKRSRLTQQIAPAITVVLPNGTTTTTNPTTTYVYDLEGEIASITDPNGAVTEFHYEDGHLHEEHLPDPDGAGPLGATTIEYDYDERHQLKSKIITDPANSSVILLQETYAYNPVGQLTAVTDVLRSATTSYEYDLVGNQTAVVDAEGRRTSYVYNEKNLLTDIQQPHPTSTTLAGPLWKFGYDQLGRVISRKDPLDPTGTTRETKYEYDLRSQLTKVTLPDPDGAGTLPAPFTTYAYTSVGEVDYETDHLGRLTNYIYNDLSELTKVELPDPDGAGGNPVLSLQYAYDNLGRVKSTIDQRGQTTTYAYNAASWLTSTTLPDPDGATGDTFFGTNLPSPVTTLGYDANGWLRTQDELGPNSGTLRTTYNRDTLGRVSSMVTPQPGSDTGATATTSYQYDPIGRTKSITDPLTNVTSYAYNPTLRTVTTTEPDPDGAGSKVAGVTVSTFDKVGNLVTLKDASNNTTTFGYDFLNRQTTETNPFGKILKWDYDFVGNLTTITDRNSTGRKREFTYDKLDRVTKETWKSTSGAAIHSIHYAYDSAGRLDTVKELRGSQSGTPVLEYDYGYDNLDRVTSVIDTANVAANSLTPNTLPTVPVKFDYHFKTNGDAKDVFTRINTKADFANIYTTDNLGRLTQVVQRQFTSAEQTTYGTSGTNTIQRKRVNIAYNRAGDFSQIVRSAWIGTGDTEVATTAYGYFNGGGVKAISSTHSGHVLGTTPPMGPLPSFAQYSWTYDVAGRVDLFTAPEGVFDYGYDNTHQVTSATFTLAGGYTGGTPASEAFDFDLTGNRNSQTDDTSTTTTTVDRNRLLSDGTYSYVYDGEGNRYSSTEIATGKTILYTWD